MKTKKKAVKKTKKVTKKAGKSSRQKRIESLAKAREVQKARRYAGQVTFEYQGEILIRKMNKAEKEAMAKIISSKKQLDEAKKLNVAALKKLS